MIVLYSNGNVMFIYLTRLDRTLYALSKYVFKVQLAMTRVFEQKWEMLNFDEDHFLSR